MLLLNKKFYKLENQSLKVKWVFTESTSQQGSVMFRSLFIL